MSDFSNKIINLRERHDWSKTYVAERLALKNMQTYANWEYGKSEPDSEIIVKLAHLFDISTDYLLGNTPIKSTQENNKTKNIELTDEDVIMTYEGRPIAPDDLELIKRLLRGK